MYDTSRYQNDRCVSPPMRIKDPRIFSLIFYLSLSHVGRVIPSTLACSLRTTKYHTRVILYTRWQLAPYFEYNSFACLPVRLSVCVCKCNMLLILKPTISHFWRNEAEQRSARYLTFSLPCSSTYSSTFWPHHFHYALFGRADFLILDSYRLF